MSQAAKTVSDWFAWCLLRTRCRDRVLNLPGQAGRWPGSGQLS